MQCLAGEEIIQDLDWDSMTGKLYHWQHNGAILKKYVLLLKLFFETLVKKKKGGGEVCCAVSYLTKHSQINSNKQIKNKVQPSGLKSTTGFVYIFQWMQRKQVLRKSIGAVTFSQETSNLAGVKSASTSYYCGKRPVLFCCN